MSAIYKILKKAWFIQAFLFCTACASVESRIDTAQDIMMEKGFIGKTLPTAPLPLYTAYRQGLPSEPLTIVIEGDGYAWVDRHTLSDNPTPRDPIGLKIATSLPRPAYYLARPCQYVESASCEASLWSAARFSPAVIESYMQALDQIKAETHSEKLNLVGFSGGAYIALVMAARRTDIVTVRTIAGLLDPGAWTAAHEISAVQTAGSIDDLLRNSAATSFTHFCGGEDDVVPCAHAQEVLLKAQGMGLKNQSLMAFKQEDHQSVWEKAIPYIQ